MPAIMERSKLVALEILFTDAVQRAALLHDRHTPLNAQFHQGHSNFPIGVSNAVCEHQRTDHAVT